MKLVPLPLFLVLSVASAGYVGAESWVPVSCDDRAEELMTMRERAGATRDFRAAWKRHEEAVRRARPGDAEFVPHPYPKSAREVIEDFRYAFRSRLATNPDDPAPRHRRTLKTLNDGDARFEVVRVENWEPGRCREGRAAPFHHLIRVYDGDGREVSRTALHASGLLAVHAAVDDDRHPMEDLKVLAESVERRFGVKTEVGRAQYVVLDGLPVPCTPITPCVAFEAGGKIHLINHDYFLFSIEPGAPRLSILELAQRPFDPRATPLNAGRQARPWITVGYGFQQGMLVAVGPRGGPLE